MGMQRKMTGEVLLERGIITAEQLSFCLHQQAELRRMGENVRIGEIVLHNGFATRAQVDAAIGASRNFNAIQVPVSVRQKYRIMVHGISEGVLEVSALSPLSETNKKELIEDVRAAGIEVQDIRDVPMDTKVIIGSLTEGASIERDRLRKNIEIINRDSSNGQILQQVLRGLFIEALESRASDIHLNKVSDEKECWVSYRIDGFLDYRYLLNRRAIAALVVRIKTDAGMDISEERLPQDGRISFTHASRTVDLRVATLPEIGGEKLTIRILDPESLQSLVELLRYYDGIRERFLSIVRFRQKQGGIVLVTGPTGSGKTTTLYAALKEIDRQNFNVLTVEDPVEFRLACVHQTPVKEDIGLSFGAVLRAHLRHDPDVLVTGEMRDSTTAEHLLRSAESGHLVMSTLHTNDCPETVNRFIGLIPSHYAMNGAYVVASNLKLIVNQRLIQTLCECAVEIDSAEFRQRSQACFTEVFHACGIKDGERIKVANSAGCPKCGGKGYYGRTLAVEAAFFPNDAHLRKEMERILLDRRDFYDVSAMITLPGVEYYPLREGVARLLRNGVIDPLKAWDTLELNSSAKRSGNAENIHG